MSKGNFPIEKFAGIETPFYYYDAEVLQQSLDAICSEMAKHENYHLHYAIKANANAKVLKKIQATGLGVDCVSGQEVECAITNGFNPKDIMFAGVGKTDWEIKMALENNIGCFNVESIPELEVIDELAQQQQKIANIALRINPNIDAHTHHYVTTGLDENKFGIYACDLEKVIQKLKHLHHINLIGIHVHIGSQITDLEPFKELCTRVNELQQWFEKHHICLKTINVGGGLGVDYMKPDEHSIPDFKDYFNIFHQFFWSAYIHALPLQRQNRERDFQSRHG